MKLRIHNASEQIKNAMYTPCLIKTKDGDFVRYKGKAIIFDNPLQAGDYVSKHLEIEREVDLKDNIALLCIEYKELCKSEEYKKNLKRGYIIRNKHTKLDVQYVTGSEQKIILFNTKDEANQFIQDFPNFFIDIEHEIIQREVNSGLNPVGYINYADIVDTAEYKELVKSLKGE